MADKIVYVVMTCNQSLIDGAMRDEMHRVQCVCDNEEIAIRQVTDHKRNDERVGMNFTKYWYHLALVITE